MSDLRISKADAAYANFNYFTEYCFNEGYPNTWFHKEWGRIIQDDSIKRSLCLAPRNSSKTTTWAKKGPLWLLGRNPNLRILMLSRTAARAAANMRFIRSNIENNPYLKEVFPNLKKGYPWTDDDIVVENSRNDAEPSVTARGLEGSIPGLRADILVADDIIDKTSVMTDIQRKKVIEFWNEQVLPVVNPGGRILSIGTTYHNKDFYSNLMEDKSYKIFKFPAFKIDEEGKIVLGEDGQPISYWPERWPTSELLRMKDEMVSLEGSVAWNSQFMLDPTGYEGRLFKTEWMSLYDMPDLEARMLGFDYVMAIDPNITEDSRSDDTAIVTLAVDRKHSELYLLDVFAKPIDLIEQVKKMREYCARPSIRIGAKSLPGEQRISKIGIDATAYQRSLQSTGYLLGMPVVEVKSGNVDKITRIMRLMPHIENGRIKFPNPETIKCDWWDKFIDEYVTFPRGRRDDILDALDMAVGIAEVISGGSSIPYGPGASQDTPYRKLFEPNVRSYTGKPL